MTSINDRRSGSSVDLDVVFQALSHSMRRRILTALMEDNPRWEDEFVTVEFRPPDRKPDTIEIELHHSHLPRLDEAGFIDWERGVGRVTRGKRFEEIRPLLELMDEHRDELPDDWP